MYERRNETGIILIHNFNTETQTSGDFFIFLQNFLIYFCNAEDMNSISTRLMQEKSFEEEGMHVYQGVSLPW
jgi:hypothetical protein